MVNSSLDVPAVNFPGMDPTEHFQFYFRRHWIKVAKYLGFLFFWTIVFALLVLVSSVAETRDDFTRRMVTVILSVFFLIPHFIFLAKMYKHFLTVVIITDKKVHQFKRTLIATDTHLSVDLWQLQDIDKLQRSIIQNVFGFGSLKLEAQNSQLRIHFVPHVDETYHQIVKLRESLRNAQPATIVPTMPEVPFYKTDIQSPHAETASR